MPGPLLPILTVAGILGGIWTLSSAGPRPQTPADWYTLDELAQAAGYGSAEDLPPQVAARLVVLQERVLEPMADALGYAVELAAAPDDEARLHTEGLAVTLEADDLEAVARAMADSELPLSGVVLDVDGGALTLILHPQLRADDTEVVVVVGDAQLPLEEWTAARGGQP